MPELLIRSALNVHYATDATVFWVVATAIVGLLLYHRFWRETAVFVASLILTTGAVQLMKTTFEVPRPGDALVQLASYSFPSGHAAASMFLAVTTAWLLYRRPSLARRRALVVIALFLVAFVIGGSRFLINVHTPLEVLGGFMVGITVPLIVIGLFHLYERCSSTHS